MDSAHPKKSKSSKKPGGKDPEKTASSEKRSAEADAPKPPATKSSDKAAGDGEHGHGHTPHGSLGALVLGALGIVFGDIGTSPLYTLAECTHGPHAVEPTHENVLGVLSLIFWALMMVVTVKYLVFIMRADNKGEGGILALLALLPEKLRAGKNKPIGALAVLIIAGGRAPLR